MKREEYAITLMDHTHAAVNWASLVMESTAVVCICRTIKILPSEAYILAFPALLSHVACRH